MQLIRFGVSLPQNLIKKFDQQIKQKNYPNRSEAIRDLIRKSLIEEEISGNEEVVGILHLLYDHHKKDLSDKLNEMQHEYLEKVISSTHVHLDHHNCLEVILLKGKVNQIKKLSDSMIATKGVKNGKLFLTSTGGGLD